jgi:hypothetical protein
MSIVSLAYVKSDWLNIPSTENALDGTLNRFIEMAKSEIEWICGQPIIARSVVDIYGGTLEPLIWTGYTAPYTLQSVGKRASYWDTFEAVTSTVAAHTNNGLVYLANSDGWRSLQYQVTATVGWATAPEIVQQCAAELVAELYFASAHSPQGSRFGVSIMTETQGGVSVAKTIVAMRPVITRKLAPFIVVKV